MLFTKTAVWVLQTAMYQRLSQDEPLNLLVTGGIYDGSVPDGQQTIDADEDLLDVDDTFDVDDQARMPYVILGDSSAEDYSTKTFAGEEIVTTMHIWSDYLGKKEAAQIIDAIVQSVSSSPLDLGEGFSIDYVERDFVEIYQEEQFHHGVLRFRFKIKQA